MKAKKKMDRQDAMEGLGLIGKLAFNIALPNVAATAETIIELHKKQKVADFRDFLCGMTYNVDSGHFQQENIERLQAELIDKDNDQAVSCILDAVFFSKNLACRVILGIIARKYLNTDNIDYEDMTLVIALKDLLDDDLMLFTKLYDVVPHSYSTVHDTCQYDVYSPKERVMLEKLQNLNIFGKDLVPSRVVGRNIPLYYETTSISQRLMDYLNVIGYKKDDAICG